MAQGEEMTENEKIANCKYLNTVRTNFSICCEYPILVIWTYQYLECEEVCTDNEDFDCCLLGCCFNKLGVTLLTKDEKGNVLGVDVDWHGLVYSFLLSVGNDTKWEPVLMDSVARCNEQFGGTANGYECSVIPLSLYDVIGCSYIQNYLKCANWNPYEMPECKYTYEFASTCIDGSAFW